MRHRIKLGFRPRPRLLPFPRLVQGLGLLELSQVELEAAITEEVAKNPLLELVSDAEPPRSRAPASFGTGQRSSAEGGYPIESIGSASESLHEHLASQLRLSRLSEPELRIAARLLGEMRDDGFLDCAPTRGRRAQPENDPVHCVALELGVDLSVVERVRQRVMRLDPVGVLARDLPECLLAQLDEQGYDDECLVWQIVDQHFSSILNGRLERVARACQTTVSDIHEELELVQRLEPWPARNFLAPGGPPATALGKPDAFVEKIGPRYVIRLNESGLPRLRSSRYRDSSEDRQAALEFLRLIAKRRETLRQLVQHVLVRQLEWFEGTGPLRPLRLREVAVPLRVHESTVCRATLGKYIDTPRGVYELKYFFVSSLRGPGAGDVSSARVKLELERILREEAAATQLSDAALVHLLAARGIPVSRRSVTRYRQEIRSKLFWERPAHRAPLP